MLARFTAGLINLFLWVTELFLALRFVLRFFDANPANQFVNWIYGSTNVLLQPFRGMFQPAVFGHHHIVDFSTLFAMAIYAVAALVLLWLVSFFDPVRYRAVRK